MPNNPNKRKKPKQAVGRPPLWKTVAELQDKIDDYYAYCETRDRPLTMAGLAYYIGINRQTLYNYSYKDKFVDTIKKARNLIEMRLEEIAIIKGNAGTIFIMKNYGYADKQEIDTTINANGFTEALGKFITKL